MRRARAHVGASEATRQLVVKLATEIAYGRTVNDAAAKADINPKYLWEVRRKYKSLWDAAYEKAMQQVVEAVRIGASTDAVMSDPQAWIDMASHAERWTEARGEPLFTASGEQTLTQFVEGYYLPTCIAADVCPQRPASIRMVTKFWRLLTGDPPLSKIDAPMLRNFTEAIGRTRGIRSCTRKSVNTVASYLTILQAILLKAGPPGPHNRDAAGILANPPWIRPPRKVPMPRTVVADEDFQAVYDATAIMDIPAVRGVKAAGWWKALLITSADTGLRARSLFALEWSHVDLVGRQFVLPPSTVKSRRTLVVPLTEVVVEHLRRFGVREGKVFAWPYVQRYFWTVLQRLEKAAGIPRERWFGTHTLRRTLATRLYEISPSAARLMLGHTAEEITRTHYVEPTAIIKRALEALRPALDSQSSGDASRS